MSITKTFLYRYMPSVTTLAMNLYPQDGGSIVNVSGVMNFTESSQTPGLYLATTTDPLASSLTTYMVNVLRNGSEIGSYFSDAEEVAGDYQVVDSPTPAQISVGLPAPIIDNVVYVTVSPQQAAALQIPSLIPCIRGDTLSVALPLMGSLTSWVKIIFTAKQYGTDTDAQSMFQVEAIAAGGGGLTILNATPATDSTLGSLTVENVTTGLVNLTLAASVTATFPPQTWFWDCEAIFPASVSTPIWGKFNNYLDITQAIS